MDALALLCSILLVLGGGIFWFFWAFGPAKVKSIPSEKIQDSYNKYWSFFSRPKEISNADKVPDFVDTYYNLVTDIYERDWGQSIHIPPSFPGKSHDEAKRLNEEVAGDLIGVKPGHKVLDVGCGVGGPMRTIAAHSGCKIVGITINEYQVNRARMLNKKGVDSLCEVVLGNFLEMPFEDNSFDGAYSIAATCHAPKLEDVYAEIFRVLKPGALYVSYDWVTTDKYCCGNDEHEEIIRGIERGDALPGLRHYTDIVQTARKVGFEVVKEKDLATPPAGSPWWTRPETVNMAYNWRNRIALRVLAAVGIAPKGTVAVHDMLSTTAGYLIRGGETGIFSPMHMILCRKPSTF